MNGKGISKGTYIMMKKVVFENSRKRFLPDETSSGCEGILDGWHDGWPGNEQLEKRQQARECETVQLF